jgi:hypothetical protein
MQICPVSPQTPLERLALWCHMVEVRSDGDARSAPATALVLASSGAEGPVAAPRLQASSAPQPLELLFQLPGAHTRAVRANATERPTATTTLSPAALFEAVGHQRDGRVDGSTLATSETQASDLARSLGKVQFTGNLDLHFNLTTMPPEVLAGLESSLELSVDALSQVRVAEVAARKAFAERVFSALHQRARSANSGLLLEAAKAKTMIADLKALEVAQQEAVQTSSPTLRAGRTLADLQATQQRIQQQESALCDCLDQLRKVTGNTALVAERVPTLRADSGDPTQSMLAIDSLAALQRGAQPGFAAKLVANNPDVLMIGGAIQVAESRLRLLKARATGGAKRHSLGIFDFIFGGPVGRTLRLADPSAPDAREVPQFGFVQAQQVIDQKKLDLDNFKAEVERDIETQMRMLKSQAPGSFWSEAQSLGASVRAAQQQLEHLQQAAGQPGSQVLPQQLCRAKVEWLERRQICNLARGDFLGAVNRIVYLAGGFGDLQSEALQYFEAAFSGCYA